MARKLVPYGLFTQTNLSAFLLLIWLLLMNMMMHSKKPSIMVEIKDFFSAQLTLYKTTLSIPLIYTYIYIYIYIYEIKVLPKNSFYYSNFGSFFVHHATLSIIHKSDYNTLLFFLSPKPCTKNNWSKKGAKSNHCLQYR